MTNKEPIGIKTKDVPKELLKDKLIAATFNKFDELKKEELKKLYIDFYRMRMESIQNEFYNQDRMTQQEEEVRQEDIRNYAVQDAKYDPNKISGINSADMMEKTNRRSSVGMLDAGENFTSFSESVIAEMHDIINNSNYNARILLRNFEKNVSLLKKGKYKSNRITKYSTGESYSPTYGQSGFDYFENPVDAYGLPRDPKEYLKVLINGLDTEEAKTEARNVLNDLLKLDPKHPKYKPPTIKDLANQVKQNEIDIQQHNAIKEFSERRARLRSGNKNFSQTWYKSAFKPDPKPPAHDINDLPLRVNLKGWAPDIGRQILSSEQDVKKGGVPLSIDSAPEEIIDNPKEYTRNKISFANAKQKGITSYKKVLYLDTLFNHLTRAATNTNTMLQRFVLDTDWAGVSNKDPEAVKNAARFYNEVMDSHLSTLKAKSQFMRFVQRNGIINDENFQIRYSYEVPTKNGSKLTIEMGRRYTPAPLEVMAKILAKTSSEMIRVADKVSPNKSRRIESFDERMVREDARTLEFVRRSYARGKLGAAQWALTSLEKEGAPAEEMVAARQKLLDSQTAFDKFKTIDALENLMNQVHSEANTSEITSLENYLKNEEGYDPRIANAIEKAVPVDLKIFPKTPSVVPTLIGHSGLDPVYKAIFQRQLEHTHGCAI
jgi:hypothetical protein